MEKIREHIEESLNHAKREYDNIYYHFTNAQDAFAVAKRELESLTDSLKRAQNNMEYYEKLLTELNDHDNIKNG